MDHPNETDESDPSPRSPKGVVHIEARVKDDFKGCIDTIYLQLRILFSFGPIVCVQLWEDMLQDEKYSGVFPESLVSVRPVDYVGEELETLENIIFTSTVTVVINTYQVHPRFGQDMDNPVIQQFDGIRLPTSEFEGIWERLVFDHDIRRDMIQLMTNMVKFSQIRGPHKTSRLNHLILFSGPPGSGKTTLCQALAQKLSIRLRSHFFPQTLFFQIDGASLLSKYFGQSAHQISQTFSALASLAASQPTTLILILLDEVEILAASRATADQRGEIQDSIRATNALLTGLDAIKARQNVLLLCTTNLIETLDVAFLDRVCEIVHFQPPSLEAKYEILRNSLQELMRDGIISPKEEIPTYKEAQLSLVSEPEKVGSVLMRVVQETKVGTARKLSQLAELVLCKRLITEECGLEVALDLIEDFVGSGSGDAGDKVDRGISEKRAEMEVDV